MRVARIVLAKKNVAALAIQMMVRHTLFMHVARALRSENPNDCKRENSIWLVAEGETKRGSGRFEAKTQPASEGTETTSP